MFEGFAAAGSNLIGTYMTNQARAAQAAEANRFSAEQAKNQMDFQERMRETQYQTAVKDLMAAGLNPMLAYTQGGAGTPSGASAVGQQAQIQDYGGGLASAFQIGANIRADLDKKEAETVESISRTGVNDEQRKLINANTILAILEAPNVSQRLKNLAQEELLNRARTTATNAEEMSKRLDIMIRTLGDVPEAKSKGKYFTEWPNAVQAKEQSSIASSAAGAFGNIARGISNMFRPSIGKQPMPSRR